MTEQMSRLDQLQVESTTADTRQQGGPSMYLEFFGLTREPFNLTPDPEFLFLSEAHQEALARIQLGVEMHKGFIVVTGEVGSGKTTLVRAFLQHVPPNTVTSLIVNTKVTAKNLLQNICRDFGIEADYKHLTKDATLNLLYEFILESSFYGRNVVVVIDEAHDLGVDSLEEVRLLTNLETNTRKLLQVVLVGQPELWDLLNMPELRALKQRIQLHYHLRPLDLYETQRYILHRLTRAGFSGKELFSSNAIQKIFEYSGGVPRVINIICSNALLLAFTKEKKKITPGIIEEVWSDFSSGLPDARPVPKQTRSAPAAESSPVPTANPQRVEFSWRWVWLVGGILLLNFLLTILANWISHWLGF